MMTTGVVLTQNEYEKRIKKTHQGRVEVVGRYQNSHVAIDHRCLVHDRVWTARPNDVSKGSRCPECKSQALKAAKTYPEEKVRKALDNNGINLIGGYSGAADLTEVECKVCYNRWKSLPTGLMHGVGCPNCKGGAVLTHKAYVERIASLHGSKIKVLGDYVNRGTLILHSCQRHGEFLAKPENVFYGKHGGCRICHFADTEAGFKRKSYKLGKRNLRLQGYEPFALDYLLKSRNVCSDNIRVSGEKGCPFFRYRFENKSRLYLPDLYLTRQKRVIEVKSSFTFLMSASAFNMTKAKRKAVLREGLDFELLVFRPNGSRISVPVNWYGMTYKQVWRFFDESGW